MPRRHFVRATVVAWGVMCGLLCVSASYAQPQKEGSEPRLVSIGSLLDEEGSGAIAIQLRGAVTNTHDPLTLQDQTGAIEIRGLSRPLFNLGDEVEVTGRSITAKSTRLVEASAIRLLWHSSLPLPLSISPDRAADGRYNLHLVETSGTLERVEEQGDSTMFFLQGDHQFFSARLRHDNALTSQALSAHNVEIGSTVRIGGVLQPASSQFASTGSFILLIPSPENITLVQGPDWWTVRHVSYLFVLALLVGGCFQIVHVQHVKRRYTAVLAERARIARDIHDTLAQSFAGLALQLDAVQGKVQAGTAAAAQLEVARHMVQHSRAEAHRSIAALRAFSHEAPLQQMLEELLQQLRKAPNQQLTLQMGGDDTVMLHPSIAENVYRIVQELIANAQQHARASTIRVRISTSQALLHLNVQDDGIGFSSDDVSIASQEHLGLLGLKERVETLHGSLLIRHLSPGTLFEISIPLVVHKRLQKRGVPLSNKLTQAGVS